MKHWLTRIKNYAQEHKVITTVIILVALIIIYFVYKKVTNTSAEPRYVLGAVERGTLITSVSGSGQVSALNQVDVKPNVSGTITSVPVTQGQEVKAGTVLATIDSRSALKAVHDAQAGLQSAQIAYQKATFPSSASDLNKAYDDAFGAVASAFSDMSTIVSDLDDILYKQSHSPYLAENTVRSTTGQRGVDMRSAASLEFDKAKDTYQKSLIEYQSLSGSSDRPKIEASLTDTYALTKQLALAVKDVFGVVEYLKNQGIRSTELTADETTLNSDSNKLSSAVGNITSATTGIQTARNSITGGNLDVKNAELTVGQKQNALQDAYNTLADYTIRAPFDGVVAKLSAKVGDTASSVAVATLITKQQIATISLNEVDVAKIKVGEKVTLTFDAVPDLTVTGQVLQIDTLGTVSQGVVSYAVNIGFDTQDDRVKPGMSVSAAIITDSKPNILLVPTGAVKTSGAGSYVQVIPNSAQTSSDTATANAQGIISTTPPESVPVTVGASNDTQTEIISGLNEGDQIITRVITASTKTTQTPTAGSLLGGGARGGAGGAAARVGR
jgi:HlyD family secretion protein